MLRRAFVLCILPSLSGCYRPPDMTELTRTVRQQVRVGMSATEAARALRGIKVDCPGPPYGYGGRLSCSRLLAPSFSLVPVGCLAHVNLYISPDDGTVREIRVPPAACTGL
jgi:hypothetical protein